MQPGSLSFLWGFDAVESKLWCLTWPPNQIPCYINAISPCAATCSGLYRIWRMFRDCTSRLPSSQAPSSHIVQNYVRRIEKLASVAEISVLLCLSHFN